MAGPALAGAAARDQEQRRGGADPPAGPAALPAAARVRHAQPAQRGREGGNLAVVRRRPDRCDRAGLRPPAHAAAPSDAATRAGDLRRAGPRGADHGGADHRGADHGGADNRGARGRTRIGHRQAAQAISRLNSRDDNSTVTTARPARIALASQTTWAPTWPWKIACMPLAAQANGFHRATSRTHSGATDSGIKTPASSESGCAIPLVRLASAVSLGTNRPSAYAIETPMSTVIASRTRASSRLAGG